MTDNKFCRNCGANIPAESRFCLKCGATLTRTPPAEGQIVGFPQSRQQESSTREPDSPPNYSQYIPCNYPQKQSSSSGLGASFWLGFVGGVFGIIGGVIAFMAGSFSPYVGGDPELYWQGAAAILFSILGIVGGVFDKKPKIGVTLMIVAAIGILISISLFGVLSCILFLVGGILIFTRSRR